jgi:hypothetical protein
LSLIKTSHREKLKFPLKIEHRDDKAICSLKKNKASGKAKIPTKTKS